MNRTVLSLALVGCTSVHPAVRVADPSSDTGADPDLDTGDVDTGEPDLECPDAIACEGFFTVDELATLTDCRTVDGDVWLQGLVGTELVLPCLEEVQGELHVEDDGELTRLALPRLTRATALAIRRSPKLATLELPLLAEVDLLWLDDTGLSDVQALAALERASWVTLLDNAELGDVSGLDGAVLDGLQVFGNPKLTALDGLADVELGLLRARGTALSSLGGLAGFGAREAFVLDVADSPGLVDLTGLASVTDMASLRLETNAGLVRLDGLDQVTSVTQDLRIRSNPDLASVAALGKVTRTGELEVVDNGVLEALVLPALAAVEQVDIVGNAQLASVELPAQGDASGMLRVRDNPVLLACALGALAAVDSITVVNNAQLTTLDLGDLVAVSQDVRIHKHPRLTGLDLGGLVTIGGDLTLTNNTRLPDLAGLASLEEVVGDVTIEGNTTLCQAEAVAFAEALTVRGVVSVTGNATCQ